MLYSLRRKLNYRWFNFRNRDAFNTPPLRMSDAGPAIITQLCQIDIVMYLMAIKSFAMHIPPSAIYVLDDGSLTAQNHDLLKRHIPQVEFLKLSDFQSPDCPRGATWERLQAITEICKKQYVIQLDSDTISLGDMEEVKNAIHSQSSFVIGTEDGQDFDLMPATILAAKERLSKTKHIQILAEANFDKLENFTSMRYVRGCSGFSGFAKNATTLDFLEHITAQMYQAIGSRWNEWGTEQVTSNIAISNSPRAIVLPHPKYCNCQKINPELTEFIHFIGPCRFKDGIYSRYVSSVVGKLRNSD